LNTTEDNHKETIRFIDETNELLWRQRGTNLPPEEVVRLVDAAFEKATAINYRFGLGQCTLSRAMGAFILEHNSEKSLRLINEAIDIFKEEDNKKWVANALLTLGIISTSTGKPEAGLYHALKGIEYYEKHPDDSQDLIMAYYVTGTAFKDLKKFDEAEKYYNRGLQFKHDLSTWHGRIFTGLSNIYNDRGEYERALALAEKSLDLLKREKNDVGVSRALNDIGNIYRKLKQYDKALDHFFQALQIRENLSVKQFALGSQIDISATYEEMGEYNEAIQYLLKAEPLALETGHNVRLAYVSQKLAQLYKQTGRLKDSIAYFEKHIQVTTEANLKERESKVSDLQNAVLQEKEQEIERLRNVELKNAYALITEKNKEITDSIHYAQRIQKALLASDDLLEKNLPPHFILYKPKDIVSGDFYWAAAVPGSGLSVPGSGVANPKSETRNKELFYLAVCDSTGHGVPGAFMSLLNITFLNQAINEKNILEPHLIFNHVRERLISAVSQDGGKDGMDGILARITRSGDGTGGLSVTYAAANNAPVLISNGELKVLPNDKMPIGKGERTDSFTSHSIQLKKGDSLYLFTDGYADQFGGEKGKKFKQKQLTELLLKCAGLPFEAQKPTLDRTIMEWMGDLEQVDDILLIGIKA
jgi:serine phosphatase RsbU (regulator of sigma subunit)